MPYEVKMESADVAVLRCWGTVTSQDAHDFLAEVYYSQSFMNAKFFIRDYLAVTKIIVDDELPAYAALFEASALNNLNKSLRLAILAQDDMLIVLEQYIKTLLERSPLSVVKICDDMADARSWIDTQR